MGNDKLRILFLASNLPDKPSEGFAEEYRKLQESLQGNQNDYHIIQNWALTADILQDSIITVKPNIIHFTGFGADDAKGLIVLDDKKQQIIVPNRAIAKLFKLISNDTSFNIMAVILTACFTKELAEEICKYVPCVVGIKSSITHNTAIEFTRGFYRGIASGFKDEDCYYLGVNKIKLECPGEENNFVMFKRVSDTVVTLPIVKNHE